MAQSSVQCLYTWQERRIVVLKPKPREPRVPTLAAEQPTVERSGPTTLSPHITREEIDKNSSFRAFFLNSLIPLYIFDWETLQFLEINESTTTQYGYTREEFLQLYATELLPDEEVPRFIAFLQEQVPQLLANGGENRWHPCGNWKHRRKNNTLIDAYLSLHAITFAGRKALAASAFDMTEMLRADATLRYSAELVYQLTDNLDAVFWVIAPDMSRILYVSKAYEKVWGRSCASLYANPRAFLEGIHPEDRKQAQALMLAPWTADRSSYAQEYRIIRPPGETLWVRERVFPVKSQTGEIVRVVGISEDITLQKQAREALENVSRQLIVAQEAERRYFAGELHDEIGQTLTSLKINIETALAEAPAHLQSRLGESVMMIKETLDQVRNLCIDLRPSQLDDLGLASTLAWYVDRQAQRTGLNIHLSILPFPRPTSLIETTCFRVVQEALTNVARHAQAREVWIELGQQQKQLQLTIRDDGIGFDLAEMRNNARHGRSSGLVGMEERVRLSGGSFELSTRLNEGVSIRVLFPCQTQRKAVVLSVLDSGLDTPAKAKSGRRRKTPAER
jgi:PAS domain S-box-containing protein